jgi:CHASE2 domain-containing sensor protein
LGLGSRISLMNLRRRLAIEWIAIGLLATVLVVLAMLWQGTNSFDNLIYDELSASARPTADPDILIVGIDDPSLAKIGEWPWDRSVHAKLIETLQAAKPRSITFDILLSEPGNATSDVALAAAMAGPAPVNIPLHFVSPGNDGKAYDTVEPAPVFMRSAKGVGHANVVFDDDGIVRRANLCFQADMRSRRWAHLIELAYRVGRPPSPAFRRDINCHADVMIPFTQRGSFAEISYADVLDRNVLPKLIEGRDVIVGATATGMRDNFPVPNGEGGLLSGSEIMANMLGALRRDDFIRPLNKPLSATFSLLPLWLLLIGFLLWRPRMALIMSILSVVAILGGSAAMLTARWWFAPGPGLIGILLVYPLWGWRRLQAVSDFMATELGALEAEGETRPLPVTMTRTSDLVGRQSEALAGAIDHMRDLRRFVADTLADLPDPMFVTSPDGNITLTNRLLDDSIGRPVAGMNIHDALNEMVTPECRQPVDHYLAHHGAVVGNATAAEFVRFVSPLGRTFVMRRSEVRSDAGVRHGHIHYLTDITALARAEAQREEVLQLLSHDMRAPQSTIIALLDGEIDADAKKRIERNARRTMQLAQDFVEIARMSETEFTGVDVLLADLVHEVADNFWPLAKERNIKIEFTDNSCSGFVLAEPDSLSRALSNLIDNAVKYTPDGGRVHIQINLATTVVPQQITVAIADNGPGISVDILPGLFTRFITGGTHQGRVTGTGLGLAFVQAVIERHHGTITGDNGPQGGARFILSLPEAPEPFLDEQRS